MKFLVSKYIAVCLMTLAGYSVANASPTFTESCFDIEEEAKKRQSAYEYREVDNSEASEKDHRAMKFAWQNDVKLSDIQAILGESETVVNEQTKLMTHTWELSYLGSPSAGEIRYDTSNGYCLYTRMAGFGIVTYTWKPEVFDKTRGFLTRYEFYM